MWIDDYLVQHEVRVEHERLLDFVRDDAADEVRVRAVQRRHELVERLLHSTHAHRYIQCPLRSHLLCTVLPSDKAEAGRSDK